MSCKCVEKRGEKNLLLCIRHCVMEEAKGILRKERVKHKISEKMERQHKKGDKTFNDFHRRSKKVLEG